MVSYVPFVRYRLKTYLGNSRQDIDTKCAKKHTILLDRLTPKVNLKFLVVQDYELGEESQKSLKI